MGLTRPVPFRRRLRLNLDDSSHRSIDTQLVQDDCHFHVEEVVPPPIELHQLRLLTILVVILPLDGYVYVPERLRGESLDAVILIDNEAKGRELARTWSGDQLIWKRVREGNTHTVADQRLSKLRYPDLQG